VTAVVHCTVIREQFLSSTLITVSLCMLQWHQKQQQQQQQEHRLERTCTVLLHYWRRNQSQVVQFRYEIIWPTLNGLQWYLGFEQQIQIHFVLRHWVVLAYCHIQYFVFSVYYFSYLILQTCSSLPILNMACFMQGGKGVAVTVTPLPIYGSPYIFHTTLENIIFT